MFLESGLGLAVTKTQNTASHVIRLILVSHLKLECIIQLDRVSIYLAVVSFLSDV